MYPISFIIIVVPVKLHMRRETGRVKLLIFIPYKIESFRFESQKNQRRQYQANHKHESSEHGYFAAGGYEQAMLLVRFRFIESGR